MAEGGVCPKCGGVLVVGKTVYRFGLIELQDVACLKCESCGYETFTEDQLREVLRIIGEMDANLWI
ncbi:MAG: YgiT-type zinc finger protein [Candidatus Odinarchaeum yellowstonii]|uniref:YgiT-type zinc finger protein n=1 Tax=Odinarchaeota yellowstonii (strain LCB_4) TaxID=1841599 RepID=A0AAF0D219_ODILC|nr:MAG: YgiT-type zinc finger protein [Candidatus Odinarchaeum yellowstonii]